MRAIVMGAGEVGFDVARILSQEQHDVVVIDIDAKALEAVSDKLDVMTIHGNGTSAEVLERAGVSSAEMFIAVTAVDEVNIISSMLADRLGVRTKIARIRSDELSHTEALLKASDFGIDLVIHPEESAAQDTARLVRRASATDILTFADGRLQLLGMRVDADSPAIGKTLVEFVDTGPKVPFRLMAISRGIRTIVPHGNETIRKNDQVFVLARPKHMPHVVKAFGKKEGKLQKVMILGGSAVGAKVALLLASQKSMSIKLIEPDEKVAQSLAEALENVLVIRGEGTDIDLLATEGLGEMDAFVAVTEDEESNLVTCLLAKHLGVRKTVALLSKGAYIPISQSIGLDAAVSTKMSVSRQISQFLRGKHVLSVATVHGLDAEIIEIEAHRRSSVTEAPLADLELPAGILIGAVQRGKNLEVATGTTQVEAGDRAIVFVLPHLIPTAERLFQRS